MRKVNRVIAVSWKKGIILILPIALSPLLIIPTENEKDLGKCAYVGLLMAISWMLELMPLAVTALLPVALFPFLGVASTAFISMQYLNKTCMLFVGGKHIVSKCRLYVEMSLKK